MNNEHPGTDLALPGAAPDIDLDREIRYAKLLAESDLVPQAYRGKPANILIATGLGASMGLSHAESLYRIDVINGKPCAAAELIASNVRRANHRLRTIVSEDEAWAETTIWRADDPENPITVRRDMQWAARMGLDKKDNYVKQPATMLAWRSVTACARLACSEALYGVAHSTDELKEVQVERVESRPNGPTRAAVSAATFAAAPPVVEADPVVDKTTGEVTDDTPAAPTKRARDAMFKAFNPASGWDSDPATDEGRAARLGYITAVVGRDVASSADLTADEMERVTASLEADAAENTTNN